MITHNKQNMVFNFEHNGVDFGVVYFFVYALLLIVDIVLFLLTLSPETIKNEQPKIELKRALFCTVALTVVLTCFITSRINFVAVSEFFKRPEVHKTTKVIIMMFFVTFCTTLSIVCVSFLVL